MTENLEPSKQLHPHSPPVGTLLPRPGRAPTPRGREGWILPGYAAMGLLWHREVSWLWFPWVAEPLPGEVTRAQVGTARGGELTLSLGTQPQTSRARFSFRFWGKRCSGKGDFDWTMDDLQSFSRGGMKSQSSLTAHTRSLELWGSQTHAKAYQGAQGSSPRSVDITHCAEYRSTDVWRGSFLIPFYVLSPFSSEQRKARSGIRRHFLCAQRGRRMRCHTQHNGSTSSSLPVSSPALTAASRFAGITHKAWHCRAWTCVRFLPGNGLRVFGSVFGEAWRFKIYFGHWNTQKFLASPNWAVGYSGPTLISPQQAIPFLP